MSMKGKLRYPGVEKNLTGTFKKGVVTNPRGRPKGSISVITELRRMLQEPIPEGKDNRPIAQRLARVLIDRALKGDIRHIAELLDRIEGKPRQTHEVSVASSAAIIERTRAALAASRSSRGR
jgi:hypothetical protein